MKRLIPKDNHFGQHGRTIEVDVLTFFGFASILAQHIAAYDTHYLLLPYLNLHIFYCIHCDCIINMNLEHRKVAS